jgi:HEAT repeat protein
VERLFQGARDEYFEDGMENSLSHGLAALVETYGDTGELKVELTYWILLGKATPYVVSEALRCLGRITHAPSNRYRRWLLERCLESPSAIIRDAAGLGLAYLDDPQSIPALAEAVKRETDDELRDDLRQVLEQLGR